MQTIVRRVRGRNKFVPNQAIDAVVVDALLSLLLLLVLMLLLLLAMAMALIVLIQP